MVVLPGVLQGRYEMDLGPTMVNLVWLWFNLLECLLVITAFSIWVDRLQRCIGGLHKLRVFLFSISNVQVFRRTSIPVSFGLAFDSASFCFHS